MLAPTMLPTQTVAPDTECLGAYVPLPGFGMLPVNAFLIRAAEPVLVDTGLIGLREPFLQALTAAINPADLRWIWVTHMDPDHLGNLAAVLDLAPQAKLVTTFLGMGKLGLHGQMLPPNRVYLLNPGQRLAVGDRELLGVMPPSFDAPETTGLLDTKSGAFFSADCFGALMDKPAENAAGIAPERLREGMVTWATVDAPWLDRVDERKYAATLARVRDLAPSCILSAHLPTAGADMLETLLGHLDAARLAPPFVGPDHAAMEAMMAAPGE